MIGNPNYVPNYNQYEYQPSYLDRGWFDPQTWHDWVTQPAQYFAPAAYTALSTIRPLLVAGHVSNVITQTAQEYIAQRAARKKAEETVKDLNNIKEGRQPRQIANVPASNIIPPREEPEVFIDDNIADEQVIVPPPAAKGKEIEIDFDKVPPYRLVRPGGIKNPVVEADAARIMNAINERGYHNAMMDPLVKESVAYDLFTSKGFRKVFRNPTIGIPDVIRPLLSDAIKKALDNRKQLPNAKKRRYSVVSPESLNKGQVNWQKMAKEMYAKDGY